MDELLYQWTDMLSAEIVPGKREVLMRFFKTAPGEYGEGDQFLGITVPSVRKVSKLMTEAPLEAISRMLDSEIHEHRLSALLVLVERYQRAKKNHGLKNRLPISICQTPAQSTTGILSTFRHQKSSVTTSMKQEIMNYSTV